MLSLFENPCEIVFKTSTKFHKGTQRAISPTSSKNYPTRVKIKHEDKLGWIVLDQIRTIDKQRILKELGLLSKTEIKEVKSILKET